MRWFICLVSSLNRAPGEGRSQLEPVSTCPRMKFASTRSLSIKITSHRLSLFNFLAYLLFQRDLLDLPLPLWVLIKLRPDFLGTIFDLPPNILCIWCVLRKAWLQPSPERRGCCVLKCCGKHLFENFHRHRLGGGRAKSIKLWNEMCKSDLHNNVRFGGGGCGWQPNFGWQA